MHLKDFAKSGNPRTLFAAFLYFDISFMVWVMLGPLGNSIAEEFHLTAAQKGLMTGVPILKAGDDHDGLAVEAIGHEAGDKQPSDCHRHDLRHADQVARGGVAGHLHQQAQQGNRVEPIAQLRDHLRDPQLARIRILPQQCGIAAQAGGEWGIVSRQDDGRRKTEDGGRNQ